MNREPDNDERKSTRVVANDGSAGRWRGGRRADPSAVRAWQQQPQDPLATFRAQIGAVPIKTQSLTDNPHHASGPGGNVVVLHGADGLVMVDTPCRARLAQARGVVKALGGPVKTVINTHWHFDHTDK